MKNKILSFIDMNIQDLLLRKTHHAQPLFIAGPCSVETYEQVFQTAKALKKYNKLDLFRAGIWKPRTRPGGFEGMGEEGLKWLKEVKDKLQLPIMTEVANVEQIELALKYQVDALWIGARTTVNPFSVQEIADALEGMNIPVFIKNPVNPDVELWSGALERLMKKGITQLGLIHRGFTELGNTQYRNPPIWNIPIEMKRRFPDLLLINDPSHIAGKRSILEEVIQKAADLEFNGFIIETHIDPDHAWSDAKQQITPEKFVQIIDHIQWRNPQQEESPNQLALCRERINRIDKELLQLISQRMDTVKEIGQYKKAHKMTILQSHRWSEMVNILVQHAEALNLDTDFVLKLFDCLHIESIQIQDKIMNSSKPL
ncbi:MAG: chorismate mutase [Chitinophagaceae bacterium]